MSDPTPRARLLAILDRNDAEVDLAEAALWVAAEEYPGLDPRPSLDRLEGFAARVTLRLGSSKDPLDAIAAANGVLYDEEGFAGNRDDYYDPRNSFMNEVLDRRIGIPITLAILYMEVLRRAGIPAAGIALPGHFLAGVLTSEGVLCVDAYNRGRRLSVKDCAAIVSKVHGGRTPLSPEHLRPVGPRAVMTRLLTNLKNIYVESRSYAKAHAVIDRLALLSSEAWGEIRDRGLVLYQMKCYRPALRDLETYLIHTPDAKDRADIVKLKDIIARRLGEP